MSRTSGVKFRARSFVPDTDQVASSPRSSAEELGGQLHPVGSTQDYKRVLVTLLDIHGSARGSRRDATGCAHGANFAKIAIHANTSHEIRTPIHAIMGRAQALQEEGLTVAAGEVGATQLGLSAQTLEARLKAGDISNCRQSLEELEKMLSHVAEALTAMANEDTEKG